MFKSIEKTALQEIGPRFTLKLRWLRKGLPAVTGGGSVASAPEQGMAEEDDGDEEVDTAAAQEETLDGEDEVVEHEGEAEEEEKAARKKAMEGIPLDKQGEFEWKWKVSTSSTRIAEHCRRLLGCSRRCAANLTAFFCIFQPKLEVSRKTFFL